MLTALAMNSAAEHHAKRDAVENIETFPVSDDKKTLVIPASDKSMYVSVV